MDVVWARYGPYIRLPINKVAAAYVLFFANGTNIVANWVKKQHKIYENSSIVFKWQILAKEKHNLRTAKNRTNFILS